MLSGRERELLFCLVFLVFVKNSSFLKNEFYSVCVFVSLCTNTKVCGRMLDECLGEGGEGEKMKMSSFFLVDGNKFEKEKKKHGFLKKSTKIKPVG